VSQINNGLKAFKTGAGISTPLPAYTRVTQVAAADANGFIGTVILAGPFDTEVGVTESATQQAGNHVSVRLKNFPGTRKIFCASVCTIGNRVYTAVNGQVDTLGSPGTGTAGGLIGSFWGIVVDTSFLTGNTGPTAGGVVEVLPVEMLLQDRGGPLFVNTADSAAVTNTTTATAFTSSTSPNPILGVLIPANELLVGDIIKIRGRAKITGVNSTDTQVITVKIGSVTLLATAATNFTANDEVYFDLFAVVTALGTSGKIQGGGEYNFGTPGTATGRQAALASTTLATNSSVQIEVLATCSAASSGDTVILRDLIIELVRQ
jgi:hypothetical protein